MHVICTAGHVDHGKSTLVRALTGMEPDRFAEERERGLTIDLGFAWTQLGDDRGPTVAFVDLPGHERFITNMLAGAGPVELALFVVAADEGWMPQSREHLAILDLLGVRHACVALTKADLVDHETVAVAVELIREELAGSSLADAPIVAVSGATGAGLDELTTALLELVTAAPSAEDHGRPRLWIDRAFTVRGAGTVVTGTLAGGSLAIGDELEVLPRAERGRIRGLQSLQATVEEAEPGSRVAVNLSGVAREAVERGDALGRPGQWLAVEGFDAWVRVLAGHEVTRKGAWHVHVGSSQRSATLHPLIGGGVSGTGYARFELEHPVALAAGDRFVLREAGRRATVGGGMVLDPDPPPRPRGPQARAARTEALAHRLGCLAEGDHEALLVAHVRERGAAPAQRAAAAAGVTADAAGAGAARHGLVALGDAWAHPESIDAWAAAVVGALAEHHRRNPVDRAAPKDVAVRAAAAAGCPAPLVPLLLDHLVRTGITVAEGPGLRTVDHAVRLDPAQQAARTEILQALAEAPFSPPRLSEAARRAGASVALVRELEAAGELVRVDDDLAFTPAAVEAAVERLREAYQREGPLTAARAKEILETSRKYALPLLEHLDRVGRTRREGDTRVVR